VINGGAAFVGILVKTVVAFPPTSLGADTAVWGPFSGALDPITWKVTIKRVGDHKFQYTFEGQSKVDPSGGFVTVLAGTHTAAVDDHGDPIEGFGDGSFTLDWNARHKLPLANPDEVGTATYQYARLPGATGTIHAQFRQVKDRNAGGKLIDVDYAYEHRLGGSGTMEFSYDAAAQLGMAGGCATVRSRWEPTGAGLADAKLTSSGLAGPATASECWSATFTSTFFDRSWIPLLDYGAEATDCVYASAEFSKL